MRDVRPPVWRRVAVPSQYSLAKLHRVIQVLMEWQDGHLHRFTMGGIHYEILVPDAGQAPEVLDAGRARLSDLSLDKGATLTYEYDFGDSWQFDIKVLKVRPAADGEKYPACLDGARAGPPEDCGGPFTYMDLVDPFPPPEDGPGQVLYELGGPLFHPEFFDAAIATRWLKDFGRTGRPWPDKIT